MQNEMKIFGFGRVDNIPAKQQHMSSPTAHNNANGSKLQFAAETALKEPYVTEPKDVTEDERIRDKVKLTTNVSEDEPPIQVLKSDTFDAECIDREQEY